MTKENPLSYLKIHPSTRGLEPDQMQAIAEQAEMVRCNTGDVVQASSQHIDALILVTAGMLELSVVLPNGTEKTISYFGRDDQFGALSLIQDDPLPISLVADQPSVLIRIPRDAALQLLHDLPLWNRNLLKSLAPTLRDSFLGNKTRDQDRFVVFVHACERSQEVSATLISRLASLGERIGLISDDSRTLQLDTMYSASALQADKTPLNRDQFREVAAAWSDASRLVLDCRLENATHILGELLVASEAIYWICDSKTASSVVHALWPIVGESPHLRHKNFFVRILDHNERVAPMVRELAEVCHGDFKLHIDGCEIDSIASSRQAGLERIVHHLRGVSIGLALGGGAARGMAHLGVLEVLDENGIIIDRMSGTSAGALTGIVYASGQGAASMIEHFAEDLTPGWMYRMLPYGDALYVFFKYRFGGWDSMLRKHLHDWRLEQLPVPFSSVTVDLVSAEAVIRHRGDATTALLESINLPGIARPICMDGKALVDGGILNVVPADVVVNQGANVVISSDVSARIAFEYNGNRRDTPTEKMKVPGGISSLIRSRTVQDRNVRSVGGASADIVIEPDVSTVEITDFKNAARIARFGNEAAKQSLSSLKQTLHALDPQLFPA